jgi:hypothetical protein
MDPNEVLVRAPVQISSFLLLASNMLDGLSCWFDL